MLFEKNKIKEMISKIKTETNTYPTVYITYQALTKMHQYTQNCDKEIGWLGSAVKNEDGSYLIEDMYLIKQKVTGATTELEEDAIIEFMNNIRKNEGIEAMSKIRVWGHSHVNMEVFASSQDNETFKEYYSDCNFFIRIIVNKKGKMKLDIADNETGLIYENIPWKVYYEEDIAALLKEYEEVSEKLKEISSGLEEKLNKYKETDASVKNEISHKVIEEKTYKVKKNSNKEKYDDMYESYYNYYGWGWDYENDDDEGITELEQEFYKKLYKSVDKERTIPVRTDKNVIRYMKVTDVMSPDEIDEIADLCESGKDAKKLLDGDERFKGYNNKEWQNLVDSCVNIYLDAINEQTAS